jgi:hypothetical protein
MKTRLRPRWALASIALAACNSGGSGGGTLLPTDSLAGTWDVTGAANGGTPTAGTIELGDGDLAFTSDATQFRFHQDGASGQATFSYSDPRQQGVVANTHTPAGFSFGSFPLYPGGAWSFEGKRKEACSGTLDATLFSASCSGVTTLPRGVPRLEGAVSGTHTSRAASRFGDLGGTWSLSDGKGGACTATFTGGTFTLDCKDALAWTGTSTFTFTSDGVSGTTAGGAEVSGTRRGSVTTASRATNVANAEGPYLVVDRVVEPGVGEASDESATALALEGMNADELRPLRASLEAFAASAEARANPLVEVLDDDDALASLEGAWGAFGPRRTAAAGLAARAYTAPDDGLRVRVVARCPSRAGATCVPAWSPSANGLERRARALAWPVSAAAVVRVTTPEGALRAARVLRAGLVARADAARGAFVVAGRSDADAREERAAVVDAANGARAWVAREDGDEVSLRPLVWLAGAGAGAASAPARAWMRDTDVLVVPRVRSIRDGEGLAREIEAELRRAGIAFGWVHDPR